MSCTLSWLWVMRCLEWTLLHIKPIIYEKFVPASTAVACSNTNSAWTCAATRPVVRAGRTTATAVTAADGRIPVAELVEVAIGVYGVATHQDRRREVRRDEHVGAVGCM